MSNKLHPLLMLKIRRAINETFRDFLVRHEMIKVLILALNEDISLSSQKIKFIY